MSRKIITLFILLLCMAFYGYADEPLTVTIKGHVEFADGSYPQFATVNLIGESHYFKQSSVDDSGVYFFSDVPVGRFKMLASGAGGTRAGTFVKQDIDITETTQRIAVIDIVLSEASKKNVIQS